MGQMLTSSSAAPADAGGELHALFDEEWEYALRESPELATRLGDKRYNDRWQDESLEAHERRREHAQGVLAKLDAIDHPSLSEQDQLNYTLFRKSIENDLQEHAFQSFLMPLNQRGGVQTANEVSDVISFSSSEDYDDWITRMRALPLHVDQTIALMKEGIRVGMVHPRVIMERIPAQIRAQVVKDPEDSLFFTPFKKFPEGVGSSEQARLAAEAKAAITGHVVPAYRKLDKFFAEAYLPACHESVGAWKLPRGREWYAFRARRFTTTDLTPEAIHEIGLSEVRRIRGEMEKIIAALEFDGTLEEFLEFLRTDEQFYFTDPEELLAAYRSLTRRIDPALVKLFKTMPRMPYGVEPIPDNIAPDTTTAYYRQPAADGSRAGTYFVNLYRPEVRPKYEMEALSLHEAVPGHHFQIALAMELGELPAFRRYNGYTAFTEGWGLYAESLGDELGFYEDPYSKFGQLTYEMWRAVRLVVDTGMHTMEWPRQKAIDFFMANAAKTEHDIVNEIDRYIAWPGQALAYKIGELKIKELRARGVERLGDRFDVREFHDVVLSSGAVPLDVLEAKVDRWIAGVQAVAAGVQAVAAGGAPEGTLVVLNKSEASASLIDLSTGAVVATVPTGEGPHEVDISPDGKLAVSTNYGTRAAGGSSLTVIDVPSAQVVRTIDLGEYRRPHGITWLGGSGEVAVTAEENKAVITINVHSGKVTGSVKTEQEVSHMVVVTPGGRRAFVANIGSGSVSVLDLWTMEHLADLPTGEGAEGITITPDGSEVWVTNRSADTVTVIDAASLEVLAELESKSFPIRAKATPDGKHVLVSNARTGDVSVFSVETKKEVRRIPMDLSSEATEGRLFAGQFGESSVPIGILIRPDGKRAYVANANADVVSVIDLETWKTAGTLRPGKEPDGLAYSALIVTAEARNRAAGSISSPPQP